MRIGIAIVLVMGGLAAAQDATFHTGTQLVVETVTVKDKSGKSIEGLKAEDFRIAEDGAPQAIRFFEYQTLPTEVKPLAAMPASVTPFQKIPRNRISPDRPGDSRYRDRRLLVLYFDMTAMTPPDQLRALAAGENIHPYPDVGRGPDGPDDVRRRRGAGDRRFHCRIATVC